jgi:hypothetical protein
MTLPKRISRERKEAAEQALLNLLANLQVTANQSVAVRASPVAEAVHQAAAPSEHFLSSRRVAVSEAPTGADYAGRWQDRLR